MQDHRQESQMRLISIDSALFRCKSEFCLKTSGWFNYFDWRSSIRIWLARCFVCDLLNSNEFQGDPKEFKSEISNPGDWKFSKAESFLSAKESLVLRIFWGRLQSTWLIIEIVLWNNFIKLFYRIINKINHRWTDNRLQLHVETVGEVTTWDGLFKGGSLVESLTNSLISLSFKRRSRRKLLEIVETLTTIYKSIKRAGKLIRIFDRPLVWVSAYLALVTLILTTGEPWWLLKSSRNRCLLDEQMIPLNPCGWFKIWTSNGNAADSRKCASLKIDFEWVRKNFDWWGLRWVNFR